MKKITTILLALGLMLSFGACSEEKKNAGPGFDSVVQLLADLEDAGYVAAEDQDARPDRFGEEMGFAGVTRLYRCQLVRETGTLRDRGGLDCVELETQDQAQAVYEKYLSLLQLTGDGARGEKTDDKTGRYSLVSRVGKTVLILTMDYAEYINASFPYDHAAKKAVTDQGF